MQNTSFQVVKSIILYVSNLDDAATFYRIVLGIEPDIFEGNSLNLLCYSINEQADFILIKSDKPLPHTVALLSDNFGAALTEWKQWAGIPYLECLEPIWPVRFAVIRDADSNQLIIMEDRRSDQPATHRP